MDLNNNMGFSEGLCTVYLTSCGPNALEVIKEIRSITGYGLKEAKEIQSGVSEGHPMVIASGVTRDEANLIKMTFEACGAGITIQSGTVGTGFEPPTNAALGHTAFSGMSMVKQVFAKNAAEIKSPHLKQISNGNAEHIFEPLHTKYAIEASEFIQNKKKLEQRISKEKQEYDSASEEAKRMKRAREHENQTRAQDKQKKKDALIGFGVIAAGIALVVMLISWVYNGLIYPNLIYPNQDAEELYTAELLTTYHGEYRLSNGNRGEIMLTLDDCTTDGKVYGSIEFFLDDEYGKYKVQGSISEKKNSGSMKLTISFASWVIQPHGFNPLEEVVFKVSDNYTKLSGSKYSMTLTQGVNDEYLIKTAEDLQKLANSDATYQLANDIDMSGVSWTPIDGFKGTLMGNGFAIKNLSIKASKNNVGFFSTLEGKVLNLKFENANIEVSGSAENVGILCGKLAGTAMSVQVGGQISASNATNVGGIAGLISVNTSSYIVNNLENSAQVKGKTCVGGIFGKVYNSYGSSTGKTQISELKNSGAITGSGDYVGGIVGDATCKTEFLFSDCSNTGDVTGKTYVGGIAGYAKGMYMSHESRSWIQNVSNASTVKAEAIVGCIVGMADGMFVDTAKNAGSTLIVTKYITEDGNKYAYAGGIAGRADGVSNSKNEVPINYTAGGACVGGIAGNVTKNASAYQMENLENVANISGASYVGGIFGRVYNSYGSSTGKTELSGFVNSGAITGNGDYVGGIVGDATCKTEFLLVDAHNTGDVTGKTYVGGIAGYAKGMYMSHESRSWIQNVSNASTVKAEAVVGCIVGMADGMFVDSAQNSGSTLVVTKYVTENGNKYAYAGGIAGRADGVSNCKNEVPINYTAGGACVGGIAGYVIKNASAYQMENLENVANVSGASYVGGIFGRAYNSYGSSTGKTQLSGFVNSGAITGTGDYVGGIIGDCTCKTKLYILDFSNSGSVKGKSNVGGVIGYCYGYSGSYIQDANTSSGKIFGKVENVTTK